MTAQKQGMKKKILFIVPKGLGGAQKMTIVISQLLPKDHYDISYLFIGRKHEKDLRRLLDAKQAISEISIRNAWDFLTLRLIKEMKRQKPDVVFSSLMYINIRAILAAKAIGGIKIVVRNDNMLKIQRWDSILLLRLTYKMADTVIAQQEEMRDDIITTLSLNPAKVIVRYNPVNTKYISEKANAPSPYKDSQTTKFIWTGNFSYTGSKGQDVLVKAFKIVKERIANAELYLLGSFNESDKFYRGIVSYINNNKLTESIHIIGFQDNPYPWVKWADCFVLPSRIEGLPNALVDAMVLGKPVVATTCIPMIGRMVRNGYNGFLVTPEDNNAMADAMIKALSLHDFTMTYKPSSAHDFIELF